jgi:hypothetical protein
MKIWRKKTLGIQWYSVNEVITYQIVDNLKNSIKKRSILSNITQLYDPIDLIGLVIVVAKLNMLSLWKSEIV